MAKDQTPAAREQAVRQLREELAEAEAEAASRKAARAEIEKSYRLSVKRIEEIRQRIVDLTK